MNRLAVTLALAVVCATPAFAQQPAPKTETKPDAKADSTAAQLLGTWEGAVYSDHAPESSLQMVFSREKSLNVKVTLNFGGQPVPTGDATNMKVDGNTLSWTLTLMDQSCKATGQLIAGVLKGDMTCDQGAITYLARKK